ncbi:MAG: GIY-YIG nuclease family protein [Pseudoramibacter sp.]
MIADDLFAELGLCDILPSIEMTISQYDHWDREIGQYTGTFTSVFNSIPNFEKYYYRVTALGKKDVQERLSINHFGVKTTSIGGFNVSEESFINSFLNHDVSEYAKQKARGSVQTEDFNFAYVVIHDFWFIDRMKTIQQNTPEGFNDALDKFLRKFTEFQPLENLNDVKGKNGIYLLVLDEYNVCYLGQSNDIRKRIMRHWSRNDYFTGTGIDMFKAKDTTRIYTAFTDRKRKTNSLEHWTIDEMPSRYTLNCMAGGDIDYLEENSFAIGKDPCCDDNFINYVLSYYDIAERIKKCKSRFVVKSTSDIKKASII